MALFNQNPDITPSAVKTQWQPEAETLAGLPGRTLEATRTLHEDREDRRKRMVMTRVSFEVLRERRLTLIEERNEDLRALVRDYNDWWRNQPENERETLVGDLHATLVGLETTYDHLMLDLLDQIKDSACDMTPEPEIAQIAVVPTLLYASTPDAWTASRENARTIIERLEAYAFTASCMFKQTALTEGDENGQWIICANCNRVQFEYIQFTSILQLYQDQDTIESKERLTNLIMCRQAPL